MMSNKSTQSAVDPSYKTIRIFYFFGIFYWDMYWSIFLLLHMRDSALLKGSKFLPHPFKMFEMDKPMRASDTIFESFIYNHMNLYKKKWLKSFLPCLLLVATKVEKRSCMM